MEPNRLLQFTVRSTQSARQPHTGHDDITQTYRLTGRDSNTSLSISHGDFSALDNGEAALPIAAATWEKVLPRIKELAEERSQL